MNLKKAKMDQISYVYYYIVSKIRLIKPKI